MRPGNAARLALSSSPMRRRQSRMRPSGPSRYRLQVRPISSATSRFCTGKPISSVQSKVNVAARSMGGWVISASFAPMRCLRRSIQNMGGSAGFSGEAVVRCSRGAVGLAAKSSFSRPSRQRRCRIKVSRLGWWILSMRAPMHRSRTSSSTADKKNASKAIRISKLTG